MSGSRSFAPFTLYFLGGPHFAVNVGNVTTLPDGTKLGRTDEMGDFVWKFSTDAGRSWSSKHYIVPYRTTPVDANNSFRISSFSFCLTFLLCASLTLFERSSDGVSCPLPPRLLGSRGWAGGRPQREAIVALGCPAARSIS